MPLPGHRPIIVSSLSTSISVTNQLDLSVTENQFISSETTTPADLCTVPTNSLGGISFDCSSFHSSRTLRGDVAGEKGRVEHREDSVRVYVTSFSYTTLT